MSHQWGTLSYESDSAQSFEINITSIAQPHSLDGSQAQSRSARHFYPRSHMPGNITVEGYCTTLEDYHSLAYFIRKHQLDLLNAPNDVRFQFPNSQDSKLLLRLDVPTENNHWTGFIKTFAVTKKGVHVVAPTYNFDFVVVFDNTAVNFGLSNRIMRYYTSGTR